MPDSVPVSTVGVNSNMFYDGSGFFGDKLLFVDKRIPI